MLYIYVVYVLISASLLALLHRGSRKEWLLGGRGRLLSACRRLVVRICIADGRFEMTAASSDAGTRQSTSNTEKPHFGACAPHNSVNTLQLHN